MRKYLKTATHYTDNERHTVITCFVFPIVNCTCTHAPVVCTCIHTYTPHAHVVHACYYTGGIFQVISLSHVQQHFSCHKKCSLIQFEIDYQNNHKHASRSTSRRVLSVTHNGIQLYCKSIAPLLLIILLIFSKNVPNGEQNTIYMYMYLKILKGH